MSRDPSPKTPAGKDGAARSAGRRSVDPRDPRVLLGVLACLLLLSLYNTVAIHLIAPSADEPVGSLPDVEEEPARAGAEERVVADEPEAPEPQPRDDEGDAPPADPSPKAPEDRELERLLVRAEQEMSEKERVYGFLYFANQFRRVHRDDLAERARERAARSLRKTRVGPLGEDLLAIGDRLREEGDLSGAREAYYLRLLRGARLPESEVAATRFRIANLAYREAMQAPLDPEGLP